jgi:hypothetical protein
MTIRIPFTPLLFDLLPDDQGIYPEKKGYHPANLLSKTFSGYHLLAHYYVSSKLAIPEMLHELQLPFDREYEMAVQLMDNK